MRWLFFSLCLCFVNLSGADIDLYWKIKDYQGAFAYLNRSDLGPSSAKWVQTLAKSGRSSQALLALVNRESIQEFLIQDLAWSFLLEKSASLQARLQALYAAVSSQDPFAEELLIDAFDSPKQAMRSLAYRLSPHFGGLKVQNKVLEALKTERVSFLRYEIIEALASMQFPSSRQALENALISTSDEKEQALIIKALCFFFEHLDNQSIDALANSTSSSMRALAAFLAIENNSLKNYEDLLLDSNVFVRTKALEAFLLTQERFHFNAWKLLEDKSLLFRAYLVIYLSKDPGVVFKNVLDYFQSLEERRVLAAALPYCSKAFRKEAYHYFQESSDLLLKANLALGFVTDSEYKSTALDFLSKLLKAFPKHWKLQNSSLFSFFEEGPVSQSQSLEAEFRILSILALQGYKNLALEPFLMRKDFAFEASQIFIHLSGESFFKELREISEKSQDSKALQACLVLALFLKDEKAQKRLEDLYPFFDLEAKAMILQAFAMARQSRSLQTFLLSCLHEPYALLRSLAASALLQNLNH